jgi:hypothetical protein
VECVEHPFHELDVLIALICIPQAAEIGAELGHERARRDVGE